MSFILKEDYGGVIKEDYLDDITQMDDIILEQVQARAISLMKSYLTNRFDVEAIFSKTGTDRNGVVLMYAMDITLYLLHKSTNPRKVPKNRHESYQEAMAWLEGVNELKINPDLPIVTNSEGEDDKAYLKFGSNTKRNNHII